MKAFRQVALLMAVAVCLCVSAHAQARGKRLILKDGSYQVVTKWEVAGDRVRFYSAERFQWEEVPNSLVDWPATNKYEEEKSAGKLAEQKAASAADEVDRKEQEVRSPTIASGLRLPDSGGVFMLEHFSGKPQLVELVQNGADINKQTGKNILRAVINPLPTGPRQSVELKGQHARVQSHSDMPTIFVNINFDTDNDSPATSAAAGAKSGEAGVPVNERFKIVRLQEKDSTRVVSNLKIALTGRMKEEQKVVDTTAQAVSTDWLKVSPAQPLERGEYALIEMLGPKQMNLYVWDFGVDPDAPANPTSWKPAPVKPLPTGTEDSPILHPPPKS